MSFVHRPIVNGLMKQGMASCSAQRMRPLARLSMQSRTARGDLLKPTCRPSPALTRVSLLRHPPP